jgi:hypothetical protein
MLITRASFTDEGELVPLEGNSLLSYQRPGHVEPLEGPGLLLEPDGPVGRGRVAEAPAGPQPVGDVDGEEADQPELGELGDVHGLVPQQDVRRVDAPADEDVPAQGHGHGADHQGEQRRESAAEVDDGGGGAHLEIRSTESTIFSTSASP